MDFQIVDDANFRVFEQFTSPSTGGLKTTGTIVLRIFEMDLATPAIGIYEWDSGNEAFVTSSVVDDEGTLTHYQASGIDTGIWISPPIVYTAFTAGTKYVFQFANETDTVYQAYQVTYKGVGMWVNVEQWDGAAVATPDTAGHPKVTIKSGTGTGEIATTGGKVDEVSALTGHTAQTGDSFARLGAPVGSSISFDLQAVDAVVDFNAAILPNVLSDTNELVDNRLTAARAAVLSDLIDGGRLDLLIDGIKAVTDALPDSGALSSLATASALATVDTVVDGIQTDLDNGTDGLGAIKTAVDAMPTASANAAALLAATVDGIAVSTILARTNARVRGKFTLVDDTLTFFLEDGSTESFALDLTAAGGDPA